MTPLYIRWIKDYEIGIHVIDYQHKKLVNLINDLHEANQRVDFKDDLLGVILDELVDYACYHFATEEKYMDKVSYSNFEHHHKQHEAFTQKINLFKERFYLGKEKIDAELLEFLKGWLINHILKEDIQITHYVNTGGGLV